MLRIPNIVEKFLKLYGSDHVYNAMFIIYYYIFFAC